MYSVIVVDDERMIKLSLTKLVNDHPHFYIVGIASNGREALDLQGQHQAALMITDIRMPVIDGLQLIKALKDNSDPAEIILLTGYAEFEYARQSLQLGAVDYLLKPVEVESLYDALDRTYAKLEARRPAPLSPRPDWVWQCKEHGLRLCDLLWSTDEEGLQEELVRIRALTWAEEAHQPGISPALYSELLHFVKQEISRKSSRKIQDTENDTDLQEGSKHPFMFEQRVMALLEEIRGSRSWSSRHVVDKAVAHLEACYPDESLSLKSVAAKLGVSVSYLSRSFSEEMGVPFIQYLTRYRMERAMKYLQQSHFKTYEISQKVGYADYPHFARTFKKHCGLSASAYRKTYGSLEQE
ncbi:response regulator receiver domain protein [Paenibacillus algicola]|uniref:Response regulator receiver domain protein n=1 Tax=Paenibacillus algicola TaxID=2565926 RepID=A0A4P8XKH3_9BACL|nr:response regulator [Paenibacillus algicola]QCT01921.1 response regulator receiver domain protein [Paenibacillus algicola]